MRRWASSLPASVLLLIGFAAAAPVRNGLENDPIAYATAPLNDPVARLQDRLDHGQVELKYEANQGYLASVLAELKLPIESQSLVFSKTSFQLSKISPRTPRAVYFNDDLYVGWCQGGTVLEIGSVDPKNGTIFYSLSQTPAAKPRFTREVAQCLQCHQSQMTCDVPGLLMRSVFPDSDGMPVFSAGTYLTTEQSPTKERWGGWYVDGKVTDMGMGNGMVVDAEHPDLVRSDKDLTQQVDLSPYLSQHSDAVALMVLAHQTHLHNLITRASYETRLALRDDLTIRKMLHETTTERSDTFQLRVKSSCEPVVRCLLFSGESQISGEVEGSTDFAPQFESSGPRDRLGRTLRKFDLRSRLFTYPCSYLIYSEQFDALPDPARQYIYRRLWQVLTGRDDSPEFSHLSDADRDAIYEILTETKKGLPGYWKPMK
jgi:hypothetical protein